MASANETGLNGSSVDTPANPFSDSSTSLSSTVDFLPNEKVRDYRTLVLCFDGTGDQFDSDNSNVVELFGALKKDDPENQLVYYQAGIGTYTVPEIATPMMSKISKNLDMAFAWNLDAHIMDGYKFLMQHYRDKDRICIFGFSRGAYIARCLAGMIHKVGLLPPSNDQQIPFAYKMYTQTDEPGWEQSNAFKETFSRDVDIEFLGVWDTVESVGIIPRRLPFTSSNTVLKTFRHALALDERRVKFKANHWNRPKKGQESKSITDKQVNAFNELVERQAAEQLEPPAKQGHSNKRNALGHRHYESKEFKALERKWRRKAVRTDIQEVWFAGCHCDVGGGSVMNGTSPCLARIPLRWMIRECFKTKTGIIFTANGLRKVGLDPASLLPEALESRRPKALPLDPSSPETSTIQRIPKQASRKSKKDGDNQKVSLVVELKEPEEVADLKDALAPMYDQLQRKRFWWLLELFPISFRVQDENHNWTSHFRFNLGKGRKIPAKFPDPQGASGPGKKLVRVHGTVQTRMAAKDSRGRVYRPKADLQKYIDGDHVEWVW